MLCYTNIVLLIYDKDTTTNNISNYFASFFFE